MHASRASSIVPAVIWQPPLRQWIKCIINGVSKGNPGYTTCGGMFLDSYGSFLCCFAFPLGVQTSDVESLTFLHQIIFQE